MRFSTYADLFRLPAVRRILLLGLVIRIPLWAGNIVLTLHVVQHLDRSYTQAGVLEMVYSLALAVSGPWRGRRLDRVGLRTSLAPSLVAMTACWLVAPWLGYWPLLVLVGLVGLFMIPSFSIVRQVLIGAVPEHQRTAVLSVDSVVVEISFMIGPILGVLAAVYLPTPVALLICQLACVAGGVALWVANPSLGVDQADTDAAAGSRVRDWLTPTVLAILLVCATATVILTGEDLGIVAAMRDMGHTSSIGWVLALWGAGSALGGIVYGALHRHPPAGVLLALLATSTALVSVSHGRPLFVLLLFVSGVFCAPTITATIDDLSRAVPAGVRGEAMGWHGSALTLGGAIGAPVVGAAIDHAGWPGGFQLAGAIGFASAVLGLLGATRRQRAGQSDPRLAAEGVERAFDPSV
jgi:MFS family permease